MKKQLHYLTLSILMFAGIVNGAAQQVSDFENLGLAPDSYWDGKATPNGTTFTSGVAIFPNFNNGSYWSKGWAYSNKKDSTTAGYTNMYSAVTASGYSSETYSVGTQNSIIRLNPNAKGGTVNGVYITNGTYAAISMRDGDNFATKFGDSTTAHTGYPKGSYPDWFRLTIKGYLDGSLKTDSVDFYLADYRFEDNSKDYIVNDWRWVDLTSLGTIDSLIFILNSSDIGQWGINTPLYYCIDNFTVTIPTSITKNTSGTIKLYPNPATDVVRIDLYSLNASEIKTIEVSDVTGKRLASYSVSTAVFELPVSEYKNGVYFIAVKDAHTTHTNKFIKQ